VLVDKFSRPSSSSTVDRHCRRDRRGVLIGGIMEAHRGGRILNPAGTAPASFPKFICPERNSRPSAIHGRGARAESGGLMTVQYRDQGRCWCTCSRSISGHRSRCRSLSKAAGVSLAKIAAKVMAGDPRELGLTDDIQVAGGS